MRKFVASAAEGNFELHSHTLSEAIDETLMADWGFDVEEFRIDILRRGTGRLAAQAYFDSDGGAFACVSPINDSDPI